MDVGGVQARIAALPAGTIALMEVGLLTTKLVAWFEPTATVASEVKFVPVIVTLVPPELGPDEGSTAETVGGAGWPATAAT